MQSHNTLLDYILAMLQTQGDLISRDKITDNLYSETQKHKFIDLYNNL